MGRSVLLASLVLLLALAQATGAGEPAACPDPRGCPDLSVDADAMRPFVARRVFEPQECAVLEGLASPGERTLLQFDLTTPNLGAGDLVLGAPEARPGWFTADPCHGHHHFDGYAEFRLWTPAEYASWDALRLASPGEPSAHTLAASPGLSFVAGAKRGFCIVDVVPYGGLLPKYGSCRLQGLSVGWADHYDARVEGQWIDVTGLQPGDYVLEAEVNAQRRIAESSFGNNRGAVSIRL